MILMPIGISQSIVTGNFLLITWAPASVHCRIEHCASNFAKIIFLDTKTGEPYLLNSNNLFTVVVNCSFYKQTVNQNSNIATKVCKVTCKGTSSLTVIDIDCYRLISIVAD